MPFAKGQSGNPGGRNNRRTTPFADALKIAISEAMADDPSKKKIRGLADKLVKEALTGNVQALREVADRLDGKPMQAIEADIEGGLTVQVVQFADNPDTE